MSRFTDYMAVADSGGVETDWKHELVNPDGVVVATTAEAEALGDVDHWGAEVGPLNVIADRKSRQTSTLTLPLTSSLLVPGTRSGALHPDSGYRVRSSAGILVAGSTLWWTQATMPIDDIEVVDVNGSLMASIELVDPLQPLRSELMTAFSWEAGEATEVVLGRLFATVFDPESYTLPTTGRTLLAGDVEPGASLFALVVELIEGCGYELTPTRGGQVMAQPVPATDDDPLAERWRYGESAIPIDSARRAWTAERRRGWKAEGGSPQQDRAPISATVYDLDPASEGYFSGLGAPASLGESTFDYVGDIGQLQEAAYAQLRRAEQGPGVVEFSTVPNPAIRRGDLIDLDLPSLRASGAYRVTDFQLPYQVEGLMTVQARGVWSPDLGYVTPGVELDPTCLVGFSDDFDREDQDLQVLPGGSGGSASWTEIGYSWYIQQNLAVQWYPNGWSLAFVNRPLCSSNQYASLVLGKVPSGRRVGPVCRCDGTKSGYAALVDSAGVLSLEVWLNGAKVAGLGQVQVGGLPEGHGIRVEAQGSTVRARVDSYVVIEVTDSRLVGRHVGMLGYGGSGLNAPQVRSFSAAGLS